MYLLSQRMSKPNRVKTICEWLRPTASIRMTSILWLLSQLIFVLLTETVSHREELPRTLLVHFPNIGFLAKNKTKTSDKLLSSAKYKQKQNTIWIFFCLGEVIKVTARQHFNWQCRRKNGWKIWHSVKDCSLSGSSYLQPSLIRESKEWIFFPSSTYTALCQLIRGPKNDSVFTTDSCFGLHAWRKCSQTPFHAEMSGSLKRIFTSALFPFFLHSSTWHSLQVNGTYSRALTDVLAYHESAGGAIWRFERQRDYRVCPAWKGYTTVFWLPLRNAKIRRSLGQSGSMMKGWINNFKPQK